MKDKVWVFDKDNLQFVDYVDPSEIEPHLFVPPLEYVVSKQPSKMQEPLNQIYPTGHIPESDIVFIKRELNLTNTLLELWGGKVAPFHKHNVFVFQDTGDIVSENLLKNKFKKQTQFFVKLEPEISNTYNHFDPNDRMICQLVTWRDKYAWVYYTQEGVYYVRKIDNKYPKIHYDERLKLHYVMSNQNPEDQKRHYVLMEIDLHAYRNKHVITNQALLPSLKVFLGVYNDRHFYYEGNPNDIITITWIENGRSQTNNQELTPEEDLRLSLIAHRLDDFFNLYNLNENLPQITLSFKSPLELTPFTLPIIVQALFNGEADLVEKIKAYLSALKLPPVEETDILSNNNNNNSEDITMSQKTFSLSDCHVLPPEENIVEETNSDSVFDKDWLCFVPSMNASLAENEFIEQVQPESPAKKAKTHHV